MSDKVNQLRQSVGATVEVQISEDQLRMTALEYATRSTGAVPIHNDEFIARAGLIYDFLKDGPAKALADKSVDTGGLPG